MADTRPDPSSARSFSQTPKSDTPVMLEAHLKEAATLKRLIATIKVLGTDANFECTEEGIKLQAMDNSRVALVAVELLSVGFTHYRCDRPMSLSVDLARLAKVLKWAEDDDRVALTATDAMDVLKLTYEAKTQDTVSEYKIKLMDIDKETLGVPDMDYDANITLSSCKFARICRNLQQISKSVQIDVSKEGVRFICENGSILLRPAGGRVRSMAEVRDARKAKKEKINVEEDEDAQMVDEDEEEDDAGETGEEEEEEEEEEDSSNKKRKGSKKEEPKRKTKKTRRDDDDEEEGVIIAMSQHVTLTFSLKYLANFSKSGSLSKRVSLSMSNEVPLLVSYDFGQGKIEYYLAPMIN